VKLKRPELAVAAITLLFLCFTLGYYLGKNADPGVVTVPETAFASPPPSAAQPETQTATPETQTATPETQTATPIETPAETPAEPTPESHRNSDGKLQINLATAEELAELPGIGEVLAARIVEYRAAHGDFKRASSVQNVSGIGDKKYGAIKDLITVD
jgi:competence protein ComEA